MGAPAEVWHHLVERDFAGLQVWTDGERDYLVDPRRQVVINVVVDVRYPRR